MIILCSGNDHYRLREGVKNLVAQYLIKYPDSTVERLDCVENENLEAVGRSIKNRTLFDARRIVIAKNALATDQLAKILVENDAASADDILVIAVHESAPKINAENKKQLQALERIAKKSEVFNMVEGAELLSWISNFCAIRNHKIAKLAAIELVRRAGNNSWSLACELEKLCAFTKESITLDSISALVSLPSGNDEWELSNALASRDKRAALTAIFRKTSAGIPEQILLATIASSVRNLIMIRDMLDRGKVSGTIAVTTGLHPFVVSKHLSGGRTSDIEALKKTHKALAMLDRQSKKGTADAIDGLYSILLNF